LKKIDLNLKQAVLFIAEKTLQITNKTKHSDAADTRFHERTGLPHALDQLIPHAVQLRTEAIKIIQVQQCFVRIQRKP
jgi:hypothetical protein